jgi:hypothetical protein
VDGDVDGWYVARFEHSLVMVVLSVEHPEQPRGQTIHTGIHFETM